MTARALLVLRAGLHTTLQDEGRWGRQDLGVPVGGALDRDAFRRANVLVGNGPYEAVLEVTLTGCVLRAETDLHVAITGARFEPTVDGTPVPQDSVVALTAGATLDLGARLGGARAYIAVRGGFDSAPVLGSRAAWPFAPRRGAILDGTRLAVATREVSAVRAMALPGLVRHEVLRVLPTSEAEDEALFALQSAAYRVLPSASRMAYPLDGPPVPLLAPDRSSSGTVTGALQILPTGAPILLMADRQTTGGYPVVAVVITADLPHAAQRAPGDSVRFSVCTRQEALEALSRAEAHWGHS
jgi:antagonist of KipI